MRILSLDLATRTGFATWDGERLESGFVDFQVKRGESPGMRFIRFNAWLVEILNTSRPELVVYEQPFVMRSGAAAEISLGFATRVQEACAKRSIDHQPVNGSTLKKWTTGKGNAKKPDMVAAVARRWPPDWPGGRSIVATLDHNEADAIALVAYARIEFAATGAGR